jgi:hypothetical protein
MEAVRTSETSVYSSETTLRYIADGCHHLTTDSFVSWMLIKYMVNLIKSDMREVSTHASRLERGTWVQMSAPDIPTSGFRGLPQSLQENARKAH